MEIYCSCLLIWVTIDCVEDQLMRQHIWTKTGPNFLSMSFPPQVWMPTRPPNPFLPQLLLKAHSARVKIEHFLEL